MIKPNKTIFKNRDREAKFWEKNYKKVWNNSKPLKIKFAKNLSSTINIRLDPKALDSVRIEAQRKGLGPTQLIRMWVMERIG